MKSKNRFSAKASEETQDAIIRKIYIPKLLKKKLEKPIIENDDSALDIEMVLVPTPSLYSKAEKQRPLSERFLKEEEHQKTYRSDFRRDYARIIHSPSFRRLQGKTQLFPCTESDFFRNRLTHSVSIPKLVGGAFWKNVNSH